MVILNFEALIRNVAGNYGVEFDELYSDAVVAYWLTMRKLDTNLLPTKVKGTFAASLIKWCALNILRGKRREVSLIDKYMCYFGETKAVDNSEGIQEALDFISMKVRESDSLKLKAVWSSVKGRFLYDDATDDGIYGAWTYASDRLCTYTQNIGTYRDQLRGFATKFFEQKV